MGNIIPKEHIGASIGFAKYMIETGALSTDKSIEVRENQLKLMEMLEPMINHDKNDEN